MEKTPTIGELLLHYRQEYENKIHREVSQKEFAEYIGIDDKNYNHFFTGRRKPGPEMVKKLASFFKDLRFYDAVDIPRPDPELIYIQKRWGRLPKEIRDEFFEAAKKYLIQKYGDDSE